MSATEPARISSICELADDYPVWFCDVWGVIHNGVERFDPAVDALKRFRRLGGKVALITNAPRPAASVEAQLRQLTITRDAYDLVYCATNPFDDSLTDLVIHSTSPQRIEALARRLGHYGKYSWLLRPTGQGRVLRGNWQPPGTPLSQENH